MIKTKIWLIILGLLAVFFLSVAIILNIKAPKGTTANVYEDGVLIYSVDLSKVDEPFSYTLNCTNGGINVISVEKGRICVKNADCPDAVCVNTGWISTSVKPIVCLPHKLVIKIEGSDDLEIDAIVK